MSLINQMLQDLDQRGAELSGTGAVPSVPSAQTMMQTPVETSGNAKWLGTLVLLILLIAAASWYWRQHQSVTKLAVAAAPNSVPQQAALKPVQAPIATLKVPENQPDVLPEPATLALKLSTDFDPEKVTAEPALVAQENKNLEKKWVNPLAQPLVGNKENHQAVEKIRADEPVKSVKENQTTALAKNNLSAEPSKFVKEISPQQKAEGEYRQATQLQQQGRASEAIQMLEQTLKTDPQHTAAFQLMIGLLIENKRQEDAMRWLQQALQTDSGQPRLAMILARLQVDKAQVGNAIDTLQKTLPQAGEQSDYLAFLAALLQREARHKAAVELYQRALKKNPQNSVWWMGLGISLQADHRNTEALEAYNRARMVGGLSNELLAFIEQKIAQLAH